MDHYWQKILELIKLPPRCSFVLLTSSSFILFAPTSWLERLALLSAQQNPKWNLWIGLACLLSAVALLTDIIILINNRYIAPIKKKKLFKKEQETQNKDLATKQQNILNRIPTLAKEEKWVLLKALSKGEQTVYSETVVDYLGTERAYATLDSLTLIGIFKPTGHAMVYHIEDFVWHHLITNPSLLQIDTQKNIP